MLSMHSRMSRLDLGAVLGRGPADEGEVGQVAGQADAAADDDVGLGPGAPQPFTARLGQVVEFHGVCPTSRGRAAVSMRRISSRSSEARSYFSLSMASFISRRSRINWVRCCCRPATAAAASPRARVSPWMFRISGSNCALKADVVVRAAQPALAAELEERDPADRAGLLIDLGQLLGGLADGHLLGHLLGQGRRHAADAGRLAGRRGQILPRVVLAEVQFLRLAAGEFRDVERGRLLALLAFHAARGSLLPGISRYPKGL